jgi:hypothetical protein
MRSLYHEHALLRTEAAGREFFGPDDVNERIRIAAENFGYNGEQGEVVALDDYAAILFEDVRLPRGRGWTARRNIYVGRSRTACCFARG